MRFLVLAGCQSLIRLPAAGQDPALDLARFANGRKLFCRVVIVNDTVSFTYYQ
jgi:hypothetical protein